MTSPAPSPRAARPAPLDGLLLLTIYLFIAALALAFLWPLRAQLTPEPSGLDRYSPLQDGGSALLVRYDPEGEPILWQSQNIAVLPTANAIATLLRPAARDLLIERYPALLETGQLPDSTIFELRQREQGTDGTSQSFVNIVVREPRGEFFVGFYDPANDQDFVFNPPILTLPSDLGPERAPWETEGTLNNGVGFRSASRVVDAGPHQNAAGTFDDCLQIETALRLFSGDETLSESTSQDWTCAGLGLVGGRYLEGGTLQYSTVVVASTTYDHVTLDAFPLALPATAAPPAEPATVAAWQLSRVARSVPTGVSSRSTIPPTWLPGEPPLLLAAGYEGDLVAYDVSGPTAHAQWRFHTGGTVYGPPAYDAARGRLFFGSTDKRLYALERNGFFLWSFPTGDNIATRPVIVGDTLVFGSEDRRVYGLDVETGALRWQQDTGAAIVSSPAAADGTVFIGSDDGALYALDAATGEERWLFPTDNAIEAAIVVEEGVVYVASRDGTLYALDAASGDEIWAADAGFLLRTAPAVGESVVYVVDDFGRLLAFERATGRRAWATVDTEYVGPPLLTQDGVLVAGGDGTVSLLNQEGTVQQQWASADSRSAADAGGYFELGVTAGGDTVWLADSDAVLWQLGPAASTESATRSLALAWAVGSTEAPFRDSFLLHTALPYREQALLVDEALNLFLLDPATGAGERLATLPTEGALRQSDPVLTDDTLLLDIDGALHAFHLPDGSPLWQVEGDGNVAQPPLVIGNTVLWMSSATGFAADADGTGTLRALDLATGEPRWAAPLQGLFVPGGVVADERAVFLSTPPSAYDLASGDLLWQATVEGLTLGGPALSADGATLFLSTLDPTTEAATVVALDTRSGEPRWTSDLAGETLHLFDRLWLHGDTLIAPTLDGYVVGLSATDGSEQWRYRSDAPRLANLLVADGIVWQMLTNGHIVALDAATGEELARATELELDLSSAAYQQRPALIESTVIMPVGISLFGYESGE